MREKPSEVPEEVESRGRGESSNRPLFLALVCASCGQPCSESGGRAGGARAPGHPCDDPRPQGQQWLVQQLSEQPPLSLQPPLFPLPGVLSLFITVSPGRSLFRLFFLIAPSMTFQSRLCRASLFLCYVCIRVFPETMSTPP